MNIDKWAKGIFIIALVLTLITVIGGPILLIWGAKQIKDSGLKNIINQVWNGQSEVMKSTHYAMSKGEVEYRGCAEGVIQVKRTGENEVKLYCE